jgi:hypothetical protein
MSESLEFFQARIVAAMPPAIERFTLRDLVRAVLAISEPADARRFFEGYVEHLAARGRWSSLDPVLKIARTNIGWCFGEGMTKERRWMWVVATGASHPIFGMMEDDPSPESAFEAGRRMGELMRRADEQEEKR